MNPVVDLAVDGLAAFRIARLMTEDRITEPLRVQAAKRSAFLEELLSCSWCSAVYAGFAVLALPKPVRRGLALAAIGGIISEWQA